MKISSLILALCLLANAATAAELSIVSFNLESDADTDYLSVSRDISRIPRSDIWALSEVPPRHFDDYRSAIGKNFEIIAGTTGRSDRLAIAFDPDTLQNIDSYSELAEAGGSRHPLMAKFRVKASGQEFVFVANHLQRGKEKIRQAQAAWLNEWAAMQLRTGAASIIMDGDFNFDVDPKSRKGNEAYRLFVRDDVFRWIEPECLASMTCPSTGTGCNPKYNSILDFVFLAGEAKSWAARSSILFRNDAEYCAKEDLRDAYQTSGQGDNGATILGGSDHRPVRAVLSL
ncbi:MAG: endonuclease, partial [Boseongicola sp. SB0673_bin_14]|nr:endonuclease [Boseongicola sp. SB0673_bin_14]